MFIIVEGGNYWSGEEELIGKLKEEVGRRYETSVDLEGSQAFLAHIRSKSAEVDFLFIAGILSLIDSRSAMGKECKEACFWFMEHRKVKNEHIVLSDIYAADFIDARIRRLSTYRIRVGSNEHFRVTNLGIGRSVSGKLDQVSILDAIAESDTPLTPEELEQAEKEFEQVLEGK